MRNIPSDEIKIDESFIVSAGKKISVTQFTKDRRISPLIRENLEKRFNYLLEEVSGKKVLIVGAGTLGNEVVKNLVLSGVGDITIVDNDSYVIENLPRSTLIYNDDVGRNKAEALALRAAVKRLFASNIRAVKADVMDLGWGFLEGFDLIYSPVDNVAARYFINKGCLMLKKPHITLGSNFVGSRSFSGDVIYIPPDSDVCLECVWGIPVAIELMKRLQCKDLDEEREIQPQVMCFSSIISGIASHVGLKIVLGENRLTGKAYRYIITGAGTVREFIQEEPSVGCVSHVNKGVINSVYFLEVGMRDLCMDRLCKCFQDIFEDMSIESFEVDLEWAQLYNTIYNYDDPMRILYVDSGDLNPVPSILPYDHVYLVRGNGKERLIRLVLKG